MLREALLIQRRFNMHARKRLANVIEQIIQSEKEQLEEVEVSTVDDYKKLNDKCDAVIGKIKNRKGKKTIQQTGE
jgi:hypothetical protein